MPAVISIGAGLGQIPLIRAAKALGYKIVAVDRSPANETLPLLDEVIVASTYDTDAVIASLLPFKQLYDFHAVLARTSGPALLTAAKVADGLGLSGIPERFADAAVSKSELRRQAHSLGIITPQGATVTDALIPATATAAPWVVKPDMPLVGKQNVYKVDEEMDFHQAYALASAESYNDAVAVESFVTGLDLGFMAAVYQGQIELGLLYDEFAAFHDGKVQGLGIGAPSPFSTSDIEAGCRATAQKLISHWQYQAGFAFFSFRMSEQGETLLYEVNPGLCGDAIADKLLPELWSDFNPFVGEVKLLTGTRPEMPSCVGPLTLVLHDELVHTDSVEEYLAIINGIEGGADIAAMTRTFVNNM